MSTYIVQNGTTLDDEQVDIEIRDGVIDRLVPAGDGDPDAFDSDRRYDAAGRLVTPPLFEPHTHLDATLTAGNPMWNETNTLEEGWRIWEELRSDLDKENFKERAERVIEWFVSYGVTRVRTHVDTSYESLTGVEALLELKNELADVVHLELAAFPQDCLLTGEERNLELFEESLEMGVDVVGGIPHKEYTAEDGIEHVKTVVDIAERHDKPLDLHIDETDDPQSRFTEILASEVLKRGIGDRTTASHATAMHSYSNAYADKLMYIMAESGMQVITNPLSNSVLQGRYDDYPKRRGHTRIDQLRESGVTVGIGQDDIVDPWNTYGDGDPLTTSFVLVNFAHMNGYDDVDTLWEMLTEANADIFGLDRYGLAEGNEGSLVVYDGTTPFDVLRMRPPRTLVLKDGTPIATSERTATVYRDGSPTEVDYSR